MPVREAAACARLRPRRRRAHRRGHGRRLPPRRAQPPARRLGPERRPARRSWPCPCWRHSGSPCGVAWFGSSRAIVLYVPLAGAGPSILRAAVMGGISVLATLAGRRSSRLYALAVAAVVALAIDPGIGADVGWHSALLPCSAFSRSPRPCGPRSLRNRRAWLARGARRGNRGDGCRHPGDGAADCLSLRIDLDDDSVRQPAGPARGGAGDVAGDARCGRWPSARLPGRGPQRDQRTAARLHRPGGRLVRPAELGVSACPIELAGLVASYPRCRRGRNRRRPHCCATAASHSEARRVPAPGRKRSDAGPKRPVAGGLAAVGCLGLSLSCWLGGARAPVLLAADAGLRVYLLDVGQGDAILLQPAAAGRCWSTADRRGTALPRSCEKQVSVGSGSWSRPTNSPTTQVGSRSCWGDFRSSTAYARLGRGLRAEAREAGADPIRIAAGDTSARAACGSKSSGPRARSWQPLGASTPMLRHWSCSPAGTVLDAAHRRRGGGRSAARSRAGRRAQGCPPRQRRPGLGRVARSDSPAPCGDLGRRRQFVRPSDPRRARRARRARNIGASHRSRRQDRDRCGAEFFRGRQRGRLRQIIESILGFLAPGPLLLTSEGRLS